MKFKGNQSNSSLLNISQSMLNKAHVIEITKVCTVALMKTRNTLVVRCRQKYGSWEKNRIW